MRSIFDISKSGLFAAQKSLDATSHNIANANTPGYTRQRTDLSAEVLRKNGFLIGRGVSVDVVQRLRNELTDQQIRLKENELGDLKERERIYQQIESVMTSVSGSDMDLALNDFFNSFSEMANDPQDKNLRNVVISKTQTLIDKFQNTSSDLTDIKDRVFDSARVKVDRVNSILKNLADVNADVARSEASGRPALHSKDQQTQLMSELSGLLEIDEKYNDDGSVEVRIDGIVVLNANEFKELQAESDPGNGTFDLVMAENGRELDPGSGSLKADIHMYEQGIPEMTGSLDKIAEAVVENINAVHSTGYGLEDGTTRNFFDPSNTTAGSISINPDIVAEPNHIAASSVPGESGNNDIALQLSDIKNLAVLDGDTLNNNTIQMLSRPGFRLNELGQNIESKESAMNMLVNQQQSESGVNIDEELSNLIKYQNAYQASAKVMNVGQSMYDTLLGLL